MYLNKLVKAKNKKALLDEDISNYFFTVIFNLGDYEGKMSESALFRLEKVTMAHKDVFFVKVEKGCNADTEILDYLLSKEGILVKDVKINRPYFLVLKTKDIFKPTFRTLESAFFELIHPLRWFDDIIN